jgi:hypothetical protein
MAEQGAPRTARMKSHLNINEFKRRLTALTSKEKDFYFIISYNSSGTPFCGRYDDKTFDLTRNSFWRHVKFLIIKGEYKELNNNSTEVTYTIGWSKFVRNVFAVFTCIIFLGLNTVLLINADKYEYSFSSLVLTVNGFLAFGCLWSAIVNLLTKRIVNQRFREEFEIGLEDEWERLATTGASGHSR